MWTYDPAQLASSRVYQLRWLVGDTIATDPQMQDEEMAFALSQRSSIYGAASDVCRSLATQMARQVDSVQGALRTTYSARSRAYFAASQRFDVMAMARSAGLPYSGQISQSDYDAMRSDPDRIAGQFAIGMGEDGLSTHADTALGGGA